MRGTIARALAPWVTAEGDGFALLVAAVKIPAIAGFNIYQRKMARIDLDAAQLDWLDTFKNRLRPPEILSEVLA
jgi:hypothetical protein